MADDEFVTTIIEQFLNESAAALAAIDTAIGDGRAAAVSAAAHGLKGSSATMGAWALSAICDEIEVVARSGLLADASRLTKALTLEFQCVQGELHDLARTGGGAPS